MSSDWTDEEAVLHDLAIAQGFVPVGIVNGVSSNNKPRTLQIKEETEEQFLRDYVCDEDGPIGPDLKHIKEMLNMVRDVGFNEIENTTSDKDAHERRSSEELNYTAEELPAPEKEITKQMRDIAVASLLDLNGTSPKTNETDTVVDVKKNAERRTEVRAGSSFLMSPSTMFKPKSHKSDQSPKTVTPSQTNNIPKEQSKPGVFVPSSQAQEYYKSIMENKRKEELSRETIWTKAEREMREIETKRKLMKDMVDIN